MKFNLKVLKSRYLIIAVFVAVAIICSFLIGKTNVNYQITDFIPSSSESAKALDILESEFGETGNNQISVAVPAADYSSALGLKQSIENVDKIAAVLWLDDVADISGAVDAGLEEKWFNSGYALFKVTLSGGMNDKELSSVLGSLREIITSDGAMSGTPVVNAAVKNTTGKEIGIMMAIIVPLVLLILIFATDSYFHPVLFIFVIGVAILINMGTNFILSEVSFVTFATASVIQLAVSMDYSIFLLHRYGEYKKEGFATREAMSLAMKKAFPTVLASGVTTVLGFAALILMKFNLGANLGLVLAKGVILSLLCVVFLLPSLVVVFDKVIEKTKHRSFMPSFKKVGKAIVKIGIPVVVLVALMIVPSFIMQNKNEFIYGDSAITGDSKSVEGKDEKLISGIFGKTNQLVIMVKRGNLANEKLITDRLIAEVEDINELNSYVTDVGLVPPEYVPPQVLANFMSDNYSRIIINLDCENEGDEAFANYLKVKAIVADYYDDAHIAGGIASIYDMKNIVVKDNLTVNLAAIIAIAVVILLTFKSLMLPLLLLTAIEFSIWLNLAIPFMMSSPIIYMGYIIISSLQLGATVDYAILYAGRYMENRKVMDKREAATTALSSSLGSVITSVLILMGAGVVISLVSTNGIIAALGTLIWRGALLSGVMVILFLPNAMKLFDKAIEKTTIRAGFLKPLEGVETAQKAECEKKEKVKKPKRVKKDKQSDEAVPPVRKPKKRLKKKSKAAI